ncbi:MAG: alpha/beta fold hydrolase [Candidatus Hydrogenedentota bacterium]|nr:MAG: alpha/beta fold hydrolase [Candidatus Hydrogenedentota bacterium]
MQIILNLLQILLAIITLAVVISYVIRRYELGNRERGTATSNAEASAAEMALGIAGEIAASILSVLLYPFGYIVREASHTKPRSGERPIILCHGYMHNRSAFFLLRYRLRKAGWSNVIAPNFRPAGASVPFYASQLSETAKLVISRLGCDKVDLIGHSMGGLIVRYFVENLDGSSCVRTAITLGAPNAGTKMAALGLSKAAGQFRPDSPLIRELCRSSSSHDSVTMVSIWSDFDNIVIPPENALLPKPCKNVMVRNVGHIALLFSGRVFTQLRRALSEDATK